MTAVQFEERTLTPTTENLLRWAGAAEDYSPLHFDRDEANARGFDQPVVHGPWKSAVLRRLVAAWLGPNTQIRGLSTRYLRPDALGAPLRFGGRVAETTPMPDGSAELRCELWIRGEDGRTSVDGQCVAVRAPDADGGLPLDRLRAAVRLGQDAGTFDYRVEANDVEAFATAIGAEPATTAPATFFAALDPVERRDLDLDGFLHRLPYPMTGGGNAFNEVTYERPIRVGDVITIGNVEGTVARIRTRATTIVDWDNKEVIVPNKSFITERLVNWTLSDSTTRVVIKVGIAYRNDPKLAQQLLLEVAAAHPQVLEEPAPTCWMMGFGDSTLDFELRVYVGEIGQRNPVKTELQFRIAEEFKAHDIEIAYPQRDLWVRNAVELKGAAKIEEGAAKDSAAKAW